MFDLEEQIRKMSENPASESVVISKEICMTVNRKNSTASSGTKPARKCPCCRQLHYMMQCKQFKSMRIKVCYGIGRSPRFVVH